ncbi:hypothetical protein KDX05_06980 [Burkholderia vietnamiensis]|uniref:hypothetical protein n=1 Tax=Burkholderia vietnamiensis TaxID=60552 RepID=UPI001BA190A1|nr:hypothetical protein [Burkholderia vietnamiensis]MBR8228054.1 hypothetical protein [Burkholderia vietnamiensis]
MNEPMVEIGWRVIEYGDESHIVPVDEIDRHLPILCQCHPVEDEDDPTVIVHNAFDGREKFETGERKPS